MNKRGNLLQYTFFLILFIAVWGLWLGAFLNDYGQQAITAGSYTGLEAMFWANLNMVIFFFMLVGTFIYFYFGGSQ